MPYAPRTITIVPRKWLWRPTLVLIAVLAVASRCDAQTIPDERAADIATAPVELDGNVVLRVRGVSSFPAEARAALIEANLGAAAADPTVAVGSIETVDSDT